MDYEKHTNLLMGLALSRLQAKIYLQLLYESEQTGYRIAKKLGEPAANTYKALESLQSEGLVLVDESVEPKVFSAVPIENHFNQIERNLREKRRVIESELKKIKKVPAQEGIFNIKNIDQVYEQAANLIGKADELVALDASPLPVEVLRPQLVEASKREVRILLKTYTESILPGCETVFSKEMGSPVYDLPIQIFQLIVPGKELLMALLDKENQNVIHAVYSRNEFMSLYAYSGFLAEFFLTKALNMIFANGSAGDVLEEWKKLQSIRPLALKAGRRFVESFTL